jgi:hypothetical protein
MVRNPDREARTPGNSCDLPAGRQGFELRGKIKKKQRSMARNFEYEETCTRGPKVKFSVSVFLN